MVDKANRSNPEIPPQLQAEFEALVRLSAKVGQDPLLVQAAGGNTSLKIGEVMWIKASGTNLGDALERDIFVPTAWRDIARSLRHGLPEADQPAAFLLGDGILRPSIETCLHAIFDAAVVVHVHCVSTIALAVLRDGEQRIKEGLQDIEWTWVPYRRPGAELGRMLLEQRRGENVAILGNHGLLVAADSVAAAEILLEEVCYKLRLVAASGAGMPPGPAPEGYQALAPDHVLAKAMTVPRLREIIPITSSFADQPSAKPRSLRAKLCSSIPKGGYLSKPTRMRVPRHSPVVLAMFFCGFRTMRRSVISPSRMLLPC